MDVVTRAEAVASGLTGAEVDRRLRGGSWEVLRRGIYTTRADDRTADDRTADDRTADDRTADDRTAVEAMAAVRALGGEVVVSHETAARLQGIPLLDAPTTISVTRAGGSTRRLSRLRVHVAALPESHVRTVGPLRVTAPARTVVDLARRLARPAALVAADGALHLGLVRPDDLAQVLLRCATWPGIRRAARVVRLADGRAESPLETLCRDLFVRHGVPGPVLQGIVADRSTGWFARVDFLWPESSTVVEADGRVKYGEPADLWREKLRQERIEELGYLVRRVTWAQVIRQPEATVARVLRALERPR